MKRDFVMAGFGGQGVLSMGLFLAYAAMIEGKKVSYVPSYGAEMRGGTANCTVTISDREISSPVVAHPQNVVVMNHPSLEKFEPMLKSGGLLLVNGSLVHQDVQRNDIHALVIPCQELANEIGFPQGSNMIMLGALLELTKIIDNNHIYDYLVKTFKGKYMDKMPLNIKAMQTGMDYVRKRDVKILEIA